MDNPRRWFASDNNAAVHPRIMDALSKANAGHAVGYGDDPLTREAEALVAGLFGDGYETRFVLNGTGANVYALGCLAGHGQAVLCSDCAHILVDETGAPTAVTSAQPMALPSHEGKLRPGDVEEALELYADMHKPEPRVLSLSQPTELGTVYSPAELDALVSLAQAHGLFVHIDGARLSNAAAALAPAGNGTPEALRAAVGALRAAVGKADAICFGGTKNGIMFGEAVVFSPRGLAASGDTARLRKTRLQLASKMRYIAAQFLEYSRDGLWMENARSANAMARLLTEGMERLGLSPSYPVDTNAVFTRIPKPMAEELRARRFFYDWEGGIVRWMASWDTSPDDVQGFLADLERALAAYRSAPPVTARDADQERELAREIAKNRAFLAAGWKGVDDYASDQELRKSAPDLFKPTVPSATVVPLPEPTADPGLGNISVTEATARRRSRRKFSSQGISAEELSYLCWACAGVRDREAASKDGAKFALRTVPSGGEIGRASCRERG